jgi:hypothetical protein
MRRKHADAVGSKQQQQLKSYPKQRPHGHLQHAESNQLPNRKTVVTLGLAFQHTLLLLDFSERNAGDFDAHALSVPQQHACGGVTPSTT